MSEIICVTNRLICKENFLERIKKIVQSKPSGIILREKDLTENDYEDLAKDIIKICKSSGVECILHSFSNTAIKLQHTSLHLPLHILCEMSEEDRKKFTVLGASCHSKEDAVKAEKLGCTYITAGHIFDTDCKKGLPGRGIEFLKELRRYVSVPIYAIGGINSENIPNVIEAGAVGACIMSGAMICENVNEYFKKLKENMNEV